MKKISVLFACFFLLNFLSSAQEKNSGSVIYTETVKIEVKLEGEMAAMMKDLPSEKKSEKILWFSPYASLYDDFQKEGEDQAMGGYWHSEGGVKIVMNTPENKIFTDFENKEIIEQKEFMTRMFLIKGGMAEKDWKITGRQEMILDYPCIEASNTDTSGVVTRVWFTPSINIPAGPGEYSNLPGLVLKVDIADGKRTLMASRISFEEPGEEVFEKPDKGKKVSREEYNDIVAEKMKEMGATEGTTGGGTVVIRVKK